MSAVKLAKRIVLFNEGGILCKGTHDELYKNSSIYKEIFDKQAEFYINKNNAMDA